MWSTVILSSGLMLLMGCALTGIVMLRSQMRSGVTGFGMLAISDSALNTAIGAALIGQALYTENARMKTSCSQSVLLVSASTSFLSFASSFISMLIMATECWANKKLDKEKDNAERRTQKTNGKRLTAEIGLQWTLPILLVAILHQVTPNVNVASGFKLAITNDTCQITRMLSEQMKSECYSEIMGTEGNQERKNLTVSVVKHIYDLLNGSADNNESRYESMIYLDPPQTKEEWQGIIMQMKEESGEENTSKFHAASRDLPVCDEACAESFKIVQTNLSVLMLSVYIIPIIGTVMLNYLSKNIDMQQEAKNIVQLEEVTTENAGKKECHLQEIKLIALLNLLMWTPSIVEKLAENMFCNSPPQWLRAMLYIVGQMNTVIRGFITINAANKNKLLNKNTIVPLDQIVETDGKDFTASSAENTEILFQKRVK